jgi:hypothetical protein
MATRIRKQWLDLTYSSTGLTADDIKYSDTTTVESAIDSLHSKIEYRTLTITKSGTGTGTVISALSGINCGSTCSYQFTFGTNVILTATPDSGSVFGGWSGNVTGSSSTIIVTMDSNKSVTATFNTLYSLTITKTGAGTGTVTSNPVGIDCGSTCSYQFASGTNVILIATPDSDSAFGGWSGDVTGSCSTIIITMDSNKSVTATFNILYSLTITKSGTGTGTVTSNPVGIDCGSTCSYRFASGTSVTLVATLGSSSVFDGWSGDATGNSSTVTVIMNSNKSVTAIFNILLYTLTIIKSGIGTGTVTSSPSGIDCGATCSYQFVDGTSVTLTATPDSGTIFGGWSGDATDTNSIVTITMNSDKSVTATFNIYGEAGYFAGGSDNSLQNYIDELLFSNESRYTLTVTLSQSVCSQSACNSSITGYFSGGYGSDYRSFIDKLLFSDDSRSTLTATLSQSVDYQSACNSTLSGYFAGGTNDTYRSYIDKLLFSNESRSTLAVILSQTIEQHSACNSTSAGYFAGGFNNNGNRSFIDKLLFSDESRSTLSTVLSQSVGMQSACNSTLAGYFAGGYNNNGNIYYSFIDKLLFSDESRSTLTTILSQSVYGQSACNSTLTGYFAGGYNSNNQDFIDKLLFSDDSRSTLSATLSRSLCWQSACQSGDIL